LTAEPNDNAGVIAPPPVIFGVPLVAGLVANYVYRLPLSSERVVLWAGIALAFFGLALIAAGSLELSRSRTAIIPYKPTTAIVSSGPFRFSRNPLYLGFVLIYIGASMAANTFWPLPLLPLVIVAMERGVIHREERYLARKFGEEYLAYQSRVRRWI